MIEFVARVLMGVFSFAIVLEYMNIFLTRRMIRNTWHLITNFFAVFIAVCLECGEFQPHINLLSNFTYMCMMALVCYKGSYQKKFFVIITLFAFWMTIEAVLGYGFMIAGITVSQVELIGSLFSKLILLMIVKAIKQFVIHKAADNITFEYWRFLLIFPIASVLVVLCIFLLCNYCKNEGILTFALISSMLFLPINIMLFQIFDKLAEQIDTEKKNLIYQHMIDIYTRHTQEEKEEMRKIQIIQHDMKHHLLAIRDMAEREANNDILGYVDHLTKVVDTGHERIAKSGNIIMDSVINKAYTKALREQTKFELRLEVPYKMDFQDADLYVLLGNAFSNAMEATEKISDKEKRYINVSIVYRKGSLDIGLRNSYVGSIKKNRYGDLVSLKENKKFHGMGLYSIEAIVKKYNGFFQTFYENGVFTLIAVLYEGEIARIVEDT